MDLNSEDAWIFILSTLRYAMGRRSYMPSLSRELFHKYKHLLTKYQVDQIYTEVATEIERCERLNTTLGGSWDHEGWKQFMADRK